MTLNTEFPAISTDSKFTHKAWQDNELSKVVKGGIPYPMLSDAGGKIGQAYGFYEEKDGVDLRGRFLVDPDGVLRSIEVLPAAVSRSIAELLRQIRAFQHVRATGEVTPCEWHSGEATLKPGKDLVGKVADTWKLETAS